MKSPLLLITAFVGFSFFLGACKPTTTDPHRPERGTVRIAATPDIGTIHTTFTFTGFVLVQGDTVDTQGYQSRWDWDNDGAYDTPWFDSLSAEHSYGALGKKQLKVQLRSPAGVLDSVVTSVHVQELIQITYNTTGNVQDNIDWSRDGTNRILFEWAWNSNSCCGKAWMVQYPGGVPERAITDSDSGMGTDHSFPEWSPDGNKFALTRFPKGELVVFDLTTRIGTMLGPSIGLQIAWSPSGRYILMSDSLYDLATMSTSPGPSAAHFAWAPTEDKLCVSYYDYDWRLGKETRKIRIVNFPGYSIVAEMEISWGAKFDWSMDGRFISLGFVNGRNLSVLDYENNKVYLVQVDGLDHCWWPSWSEDGSLLAFEAEETGTGTYVRQEIWAIRWPQEL